MLQINHIKPTAQKMETTKTNAKLLSSEKVKAPDVTSVFFGLAMVFSKVLVYSMGAAVVVTAPVSISRVAVTVVDVPVSFMRAE